MKRTIIGLCLVLVVIAGMMFAKQTLFASLPKDILDKPVKYKCNTGVCETTFGTYGQLKDLVDSVNKKDSNSSAKIAKGTNGKLDIIFTDKSKATKMNLQLDNDYVLRQITANVAGKSEVMTTDQEISRALTMLGFGAKIVETPVDKAREAANLKRRLYGELGGQNK
jgi:hypothetical protein